MKKTLTLIIVLFCVVLTNAQNYAILHVDQDESGDYAYCMNDYDGVIIYAQANCPSFEWWVGDEYLQNVEYITLNNSESSYNVSYSGCGIGRFYSISFNPSEIANPFPAIVWKHQGDSIRLDTGYDGLWHHWSNGSNQSYASFVVPGDYTVTITDSLCLNQTFPIGVYDNVEIYHVGRDLATGYDKATWIVNPTMSNVFDQVKVICDYYGTAGYAPYTQGEFLNIGVTSDNRSHIYQLVGVMYDGTECPIMSFSRGTPHVDYTDNDTGDKLNMSWTSPHIESGSSTSVAYINICKYANGSLTVVDPYLPANLELASYDMEIFNNAQAVVAFAFTDGRRDDNDFSYANFSRYIDVDDVGENDEKGFSVYPNPSNGTFTVEGASTITICNMMGQVVAMSFNENGVHTISIGTPGSYFVYDDEGNVSKVVIQ